MQTALGELGYLSAKDQLPIFGEVAWCRKGLNHKEETDDEDDSVAVGSCHREATQFWKRGLDPPCIRRSDSPRCHLYGLATLHF